MSHKFQLVRRQVDKSSLYTPTEGALVALDDTGLCLLAEGQLGLVACDPDDLALLEDAPDGVVLELDITTYLLKKVSEGAVAGNILFEQQNRVAIHKVDGEIYWNNANAGAFNPNALMVSFISNPLGLTQIRITTF